MLFWRLLRYHGTQKHSLGLLFLKYKTNIIITKAADIND